MGGFKLKHSQHLLENYLFLEEHLKDLVLVCPGSTDKIRSCTLIMAALSPMLKEALLDQPEEDVVLVLPDQQCLNDAKQFLELLLSPDFSYEDLIQLKDFCSDVLCMDKLDLIFGQEEDIFEDSDRVEEMEEEPVNSKKCLFCEKIYSHTKARNKHMLSVHRQLCQQNGLFFPCSFCQLKFTSEGGLNKHMKKSHPNVTKAKLNCPFGRCQQDFKDLKSLRSHVKQTHREIALTDFCLLCGLEVGPGNNMQAHLQGCHFSSDFVPKCRECQQCFASDYVLQCHRKQYHHHQEHKCKHCDRTFKSETICQRHELSHSKTFSCHECHKSFSSKHNLERHWRTSHSSSTAKLTCPQCDKTFVDKTRLKQHMWIHRGEEPYQCPSCDQGFRHLSHLKSHQVKAHGKEKEHQCGMCDQAFLYAYQLKNHIAKQHPQRSSTVQDRDEDTIVFTGDNDASLVPALVLQPQPFVIVYDNNSFHI